jgi:hypothetical protein
MPTTTTAVRKKTGEICTVEGKYLFDGYTDGSTYPPPTLEERVLDGMERGDTFPPVRSCNKGAWWLLK